MTKKIFQSIFIVALVVVFASIGIATSFLYDYFNKSQVNQLNAELSLVADTVNPFSYIHCVVANTLKIFCDH